MIIHHADHPEDPHGIRVIITRETGARSSTLWDQTLPAGSAIALHRHPTEEILTFLTGQATLTLGESTYTVEADTSVFIPPNTPHAVQNDGNSVLRLLAFFPTATPIVTD
jgi:quercetin dioxygenase-like cupin family protein